jgi:hypothetical protein
LNRGEASFSRTTHHPRTCATQDAHELAPDNDNDAEFEPEVYEDDDTELRSQAALARELVDAHRDASKSDADADAQEALKNAVEKCKAAALRKGDQVVRDLNNYHHLRRLREILGNVRGAEKLSAELIDSSIRGLEFLPGYEGGTPRSMQHKSFPWAGFNVTIVPKPACRVWTPDDETDRYETTWSDRGVFHKMRAGASANTHDFEEEMQKAKRHKAASREFHLQMAYAASEEHRKINRSADLADLPAVNQLIVELNAHRRNGPSQFFETHEAVREYMGMERTADAVTLDDSEVMRYEKALDQEKMMLLEAAMRSDLSLAIDKLALGSPTSRWASAEERTEALIKLQRKSEKRRSDMTDEEKRILSLYRAMITFCQGDAYWNIWRDELNRIDSVPVQSQEQRQVCVRMRRIIAALFMTIRAQEKRSSLDDFVKQWYAINGDDNKASQARKIYRSLSELRLEQKAVGDDPAKLFVFAHSEAEREAFRDDVYKMNHSPMQSLLAMWAVQKFGWSWVLDAKHLDIAPNDPEVRKRLEEIVRKTGQSALPKKLSIVNVCGVMNSVLKPKRLPTYAEFVYEKPETSRVTTYTVRLESSLPAFLLTKLDTKPNLGSSPWSAFYSIAKHTRCSQRCDGVDFCPVKMPIVGEVRRLRILINRIIDKLTDEFRPISTTDADVEHARLLRDALDYVPEVLLTLSRDGRWRRRLEKLCKLCKIV